MIRVFENLQEYNTFTNNGQNLVSGDLYWVKGEKSAFFLTNNIDGEVKKYDMMDEIPEGYIIPTGNIAINANGEEIDISQYATASVNVPIPEGYIVPSGNKEITQNGTNIDVVQYATATVAVPQPTGNISITENGENIDIAQYATATVNVEAPEKDYIVKGAVYDPTETYSGEFRSGSYITSVTIPSGFTSIANSAFSYIESLESLTIPNTVTTIGDSIFHRSFTIDTLTIPDSVTTIGYNMLNNGDSTKQGGVKNIVIGSGLSTVTPYYSGYNGFFGEASTRRCETIKVSPNNTTYDSRDNCNAIIETATNTLLVGCNGTVIPSSVIAIKEYAFDNCYTLPTITIPEGVTSIGRNTFYNCSSLTSVTIPSTVTTIGYSAFSNCTSLTDITIPSTVTTIDNYAFNSCSSLTTITIPDSVTSIGNSAFNYCNKLTSITILATTPPTLGSDAFGYSSNKVNTIYVPAESVDAYKSATNWNKYASKIQAIPAE